MCRLSENINLQFIVTSLRNRYKSESLAIYCFYRAMFKSSKQLSDFTENSRNNLCFVLKFNYFLREIDT